MTKQRQLILDIIENSSEHLTAEQIFCEAKRRLPSIVVATVYNNLNALAEQGTVRRVKIARQPDHYDRNTAPHDHLVCDCCGAIADVSIGDILPELEARTGIRLISCELSLHYLCPACRKKKGL